MPNLTVTALDTASAMDEIWDKLGPDAMIVSTKKQNGKIVMEATTEIGVKKSEPSNASDGDFGKLFSNQMIGETSLNKSDQSSLSDNVIQKRELIGLRQDIAALQDMLFGMVITNLDGVNPALAHSTRLALQRAGFSPQILQDLQVHYAGFGYKDGSQRFLQALASDLVYPTSATILQKRLLFVVGTSGTGRTTISAKLAAMLREQNPSKEIVLASLNEKNSCTNHQLQSFSRLLNLPTVALSHATQSEDFDKMTDYDYMVVDVHSDSVEVLLQINEIVSKLGDANVGTLLTIPGSSSPTMIDATLKRFHKISPLITLTKLDECETKPSEFSVLAENKAKIALLSGTKSVIDPAVFASETILLQYLKENFVNYLSPNSTTKELE